MHSAMKPQQRLVFSWCRCLTLFVVAVAGCAYVGWMFLNEQRLLLHLRQEVQDLEQELFTVHRLNAAQARDLEAARQALTRPGGYGKRTLLGGNHSAFASSSPPSAKLVELRATVRHLKVGQRDFFAHLCASFATAMCTDTTDAHRFLRQCQAFEPTRTTAQRQSRPETPIPTSTLSPLTAPPQCALSLPCPDLLFFPHEEVWHDYRRQLWRSLVRDLVYNPSRLPLIEAIRQGFVSSPGSAFAYVQPTIDCDLNDFKRYIVLSFPPCHMFCLFFWGEGGVSLVLHQFVSAPISGSPSSRLILFVSPFIHCV
jgi:hypothetical protein